MNDFNNEGIDVDQLHKDLSAMCDQYLYFPSSGQTAGKASAYEIYLTLRMKKELPQQITSILLMELFIELIRILQRKHRPQRDDPTKEAPVFRETLLQSCSRLRQAHPESAWALTLSLQGHNTSQIAKRMNTTHYHARQRLQKSHEFLARNLGVTF